MAADLIAPSGRVDLVTQASRAAAYRGQVNEAAAFPIPDLASLLDGPEGYPRPRCCSASPARRAPSTPGA